MRILIIGGHGTIGKKVAEHFSKHNEVLIGGRKSGDFLVDISNTESIEQLFMKVGMVDAIINIAGDAKWDHFDNLSEDDYYIGIKSKLMGQVNLVRIGRAYVKQNGSIILTTGILADRPVPMTASASMVNGAIHSFVKAVQLELETVRVNVVSSGLVEDAVEKYQPYFPGHKPVSMERVVDTYKQAVSSLEGGQILRVYE